MENKLDLKHLAPYLPYGLEMRTKCNSTIKLLGFNQVNGRLILQLNVDEEDISVDEIKPILRPLSSLIKEIEHKGKKFVPIDYFDIGDEGLVNVQFGRGNVNLIGLLKDIAKYNFILLGSMQYGVIKSLIEWHFDIFGLIEKGLAIEK